MNKHQKALEALNFLCEHAMEWVVDYDWNENPNGGYIPIDKNELKEYEQPLLELIEKATPKKPNYEGDGYSNGEFVYDTWICPHCEKRYEVDYDNYKYCPKCGQALDLGEENE